MIPITDAIRDPKLFGSTFGDLGSWRAWMVVLAAAFGLGVERRDRALFRKITGRTRAPRRQVSELYFVVGRRGRKSWIEATIGVYLSAFLNWAPHLAPGERATVPLIANDKRQARVLMRYVRALIDGSPLLRAMVEGEAAETVELNNRTSIEIHTGSFRSVRGLTVVAALLDEAAFMPTDELATPDSELVDALRPAMATLGGRAMLVVGSSPYRRQGVLYAAWRDHWGRDDDDVLVVHADTLTMNPTIPQKVIDAAYTRDPAAAAAEWGAQWRSDIGEFLDDDLIDAAVDEDRPPELPPRAGMVYVAFTDPSGGRGDAFTLAIAHAEDDRVVVDVVRGRCAPFDPRSVTAEYAAVLRSYGVHQVTGDRYGAEWVKTAFEAEGISYSASERPKSAIYAEALPLFTTGRARIPRLRPLIVELRQLERRSTRAGDVIDHPRGGHDDHANAVCGAMIAAAGGVDGFDPDGIVIVRRSEMSCLPEHGDGRPAWESAFDLQPRPWERENEF